MHSETVSFGPRCGRLSMVCAILNGWREKQPPVVPLRASFGVWVIQSCACRQSKQRWDEPAQQHPGKTLLSQHTSAYGTTARILATKLSEPWSRDRQSRLVMRPVCATGSTALWTNGERCATGARTR